MRTRRKVRNFASQKFRLTPAPQICGHWPVATSTKLKLC